MENTKPIFAPEPVYGARLVGFVLLSVVLMICDQHFDYLKTVRAHLATVAYPVQWVMNVPLTWRDSIYRHFKGQNALTQENAHLQASQLILQAKLQKMLSLESENARLRALLQSSETMQESFVIAEILQIDPDPFTHVVVLNKGQQNGVYLGQPLVDAEGVMGRVIEVNIRTSRAMLITDMSHGIPIENLRNGVRAIAVGTGSIDKLELQHVPVTTDLKIGDTLMTSGLGGGYPFGYPVGVVSQIIHEPGAPFASIWVKPTAHLEQSRQVLMIHTHQSPTREEPS